jgi:hypothetical protein
MKKLFLLLILPVFIFSCKKDKDEEAPVITISSPAAGFQATVYDTLHVVIHCTDNVQLQTLQVKLETTDLAPVLGTVTVNMNGTSYDAVFDYVINNSRIYSGNYYLTADAYDGTNTGHAYSSIYVTGIPKQLKGFFAATIPVPGTLTIYKSDTSWIPTVFDSYASDFTDMAVSDYWQQVYVDGKYTGPLKATSIDGSTAGFSIPSIAGSNPYWGPMSVLKNRLWVSYAGLNQFKSIDQLGSSNYTGHLFQNMVPGIILQNDDKIMVEQRSLTNTISMGVFSLQGFGLHETSFPFDPLAFYAKDASEIYVVGNNGTQGILSVFDEQAVAFWSPITLPSATVTSSAQVDSNTLLIGMNNGNIYKFTYNPVGLIPIASGINPTQLRFDAVNQEVYSVEGSNVKVYNLNPFSLVRVVPFPTAISDLELWYNL